MIAEVTRLRRKGLRLRSGEVSEPVRGIFELLDDDGQHTSQKRPTRVAHLYEEIGVQRTRRSLLLPLHDVQVIRVEGNVITLTGLELDSAKDGNDFRTLEHGQVWRVAVIPAPA